MKFRPFCLKKRRNLQAIGAVFFSFGLILTAFLLMHPVAVTSNPQQPVVFTVQVENTVTAGTAKHINRGIKTAEANNAAAIVILINTPGGLVTATLDIIQDISASKIPVITYVTPQGAIAASAGTFILMAGHVAAMSPGTTCGAAMPVTMTAPGTEPQAADQKTINFLAEHMRSTAQERDKPGDIAERFVLENLSLNYQDAFDQGVVDLTAASLEEVLARVNGSKVTTAAGEITINTANAQVRALDMNIEEQLTNIISNPTLAMIFLMLGIYGLIIGFNSPGYLLPEVLGSVSLVLGLFGLGLFEVNIAAGLFILLGIVLLITEAFTPTHGILAAGGIASIVLGIIFFPAEPMMPSGWFISFRVMAIGVGLVGAGFMVIVLTGIIRLRRLKPVQGKDEFTHLQGQVITPLQPEGQIKIKGEIWRAISKNGNTIPKGQAIRVVSREGMVLIVEPLEYTGEESKH